MTDEQHDLVLDLLEEMNGLGEEDDCVDGDAEGVASFLPEYASDLEDFFDPYDIDDLVPIVREWQASRRIDREINRRCEAGNVETCSGAQAAIEREVRAAESAGLLGGRAA